MPGRAVIYLRTARAEPRVSSESPSIRGQRQICKQAAAGLAAEVVAEFVDDGVAGTTLDRPGLAACLARLDATPSVDYVVVTDFSRLGRGSTLRRLGRPGASPRSSAPPAAQKVDTAAASH